MPKWKKTTVVSTDKKSQSLPQRYTERLSIKSQISIVDICHINISKLQ